jgi:hypothetical protein
LLLPLLRSLLRLSHTESDRAERLITALLVDPCEPIDAETRPQQSALEYHEQRCAGALLESGNAKGLSSA